MCLIASPPPKFFSEEDSKKTITAYKIVGKNHYFNCYHSVIYYTPLTLGEWITATDVSISLSYLSKNKYPSGFHCYKNLEDAKYIQKVCSYSSQVIVEIEITDLVCERKECTTVSILKPLYNRCFIYSVIVAKKMKVIREVST